MNEIVETLKVVVQSVLWAFITMALPLVIGIHLNNVYGFKDSMLIFCLGYWWYMVVSGSDKVSAWLAAILNIKQERGSL